MIECDNCETAQFLQIIQSRVYFEEKGMIEEVTERYECTMCGASGMYSCSDDTVSVSGDVRESNKRPRVSL